MSGGAMRMAERRGGVTRLLLFRVAGHGYASPRKRVRQVVDVGAGQPAVPGLEPSSLDALDRGGGLVGLVSMRRLLGLPDRGPEGRLVVAETGDGPFGFLVDEVVAAVDVPAAAIEPVGARLGTGYVSAVLLRNGVTWSIVDWDALRAAAPPAAEPS